VYKVVAAALHYAALTRGAFDPTVGPLVKLWGIGTDHAHVPTGPQIQAALALINWQDVVMNPADSSIFLKRPGMALDLGAIAKGYAADEAAALIRTGGIKRAVINLGGNIMLLGEKPEAKPWQVGVQNPLEPRGDFLGILTIPAASKARTVVTSGVYERFFEVKDPDGTVHHYHHLLSTRDGFPVQNGLLSVSICTARSIDADALSTSVFVLGYEKGGDLVRSLPGVAAVFVFADKTVALVNAPDFKLTNGDFRMLH
jgi:thiamine biosynthesis lipoprotein